MARDKTDQSALTPARNTRSQRRLASQDERASTSGDETSFDMKITSDTYLLDLNESFAAHMMAGNSTTAGDATFAVPQSPKRRTKGRRTPSPAKARSEELYIPSDDVIADEQPSAKALDVSPTLPTSATQSTTVPPAKVSAAKSATSSSQVFPSTGNDAAASSSNPSTTEAESGGKSAPRRKSLIARPVPAKNTLSASTTAPSNAWLSRKPSRPTLPTPSTSSSPASGELITSASETPAPEPSVQPTPSEAGLIPTASEPAAPAFRKIVKLKRTGLTRVSRSSAGNSAVSDSQSSSNDLSTPPPVPAPTTSVEQKPANKPSPPPTSVPVMAEPEPAPQPIVEPSKSRVQSESPRVEEKKAALSSPPQAPEPSTKTDLKESGSKASIPPTVESILESSQEISFVEPPPRVAAHVPKPLPVITAKPKRPRPVQKEETEAAKPGEVSKNTKKEDESQSKKIKTEHPNKTDATKAGTKVTGVGRGLPSNGPVRPSSRTVSSAKAGRAFSAPTAASKKRVPLTDRSQQRAVSAVTKGEKAPTVPHAFTFQSDRRLDLKKAVQEIKQKPSTKVVLQTFKPAHHPATLDKPTAASLSRALATVSQSENQPPTAGKAPSKKTSTLATHAKFQPTVPQAPKFALDERMKERSVFDEVLRQKEEERQKAEEAELEAEERRKEQEVKELRKLLDETARANVHPVPEWYKERPKLKKEADGAGVPS